MKNKRIVYTVRARKSDIGGWDVWIRGRVKARWNYKTKREAVKFITAKARDDWRQDFIRSQVVIYLKNGRIQEERTYPDTSRRRKG